MMMMMNYTVAACRALFGSYWIVWSCDAMQNNKMRKAKFSRVCSANLELTTDDRSRYVSI